MGYDITRQRVADTAAVHLKGADGEFLYDEGKPVQVIVYGPGSKQYAAMDQRATSRAVKRMQENDGKIAVGSSEERIEEQAEDLADITVSFENLDYNLAAGQHGRDLFKAMYADPALGFIPPQILKALKDWGKFKPGSATA